GDRARAVDRGRQRIGLGVADAGRHGESVVAGGAGEHVVADRRVVVDAVVGDELATDVADGGLAVEQHRRREHGLAIDRRQRGVVGLGVAHAGGDVGADVAERAAQRIVGGGRGVVAVAVRPVGVGGLVLVDQGGGLAGDVDLATGEHIADDIDAVEHVPVAVDRCVVAFCEGGRGEGHQGGGEQGRLDLHRVVPCVDGVVDGAAGAAPSGVRSGDQLQVPQEATAIDRPLCCALPTPAAMLTPMLPTAADKAEPESGAVLSRSIPATTSFISVSCSLSAEALATLPELWTGAASALDCALPTPAATLRPMLPAALASTLSDTLAS